MSLLSKIVPLSIKRKIKKILHMDKTIAVEKIANEIAERKVAALLATNQGKVLAGKVAVITGATGFIGQEIAKRLAGEGAAVYLCGRNMDKVSQICELLQEKGGNYYPLIFDITDETFIKSAFEKVVAEQGSFDILVNCAGGSARDDWNFICNQSEEIISRIIDTNLKGTILCSKWAAKHMIAQNCGRIINISSTVGVGGKSGFSDYAAAKAGIIGFTKSLALELGQYAITVNCVTPGIVFRGEFNTQTIDGLTNKNTMNSIGIANDIAYGVAFFASPEANFITGQNLIADGGRSLGLKGD